jgi:hypothetical protein
MNRVIYLIVFLLLFINSFSPAFGHDSEQILYWEKCNLTWKVEGKASKKIVRSKFKTISKINSNFNFKYTNSNPDILITSDLSKSILNINEIVRYEFIGFTLFFDLDGKIEKSYIHIKENYTKNKNLYLHEIIHAIGLYNDTHNHSKKSIMYSELGHKGQKLTKKDKRLISNAFCGER